MKRGRKDASETDVPIFSNNMKELEIPSASCLTAKIHILCQVQDMRDICADCQLLIVL